MRDYVHYCTPDGVVHLATRVFVTRAPSYYVPACDIFARDDGCADAVPAHPLVNQTHPLRSSETPITCLGCLSLPLPRTV